MEYGVEYRVVPSEQVKMKNREVEVTHLQCGVRLGIGYARRFRHLAKGKLQNVSQFPL